MRSLSASWQALRDAHAAMAKTRAALWLMAQGSWLMPHRPSALRNLVVKKRGRNDAAVEVAQIQFLVRRVRVLVRKAHAEQYRRQPEDLLERRDDRNRAALAIEHRLLAEAFLNRAARGL